MKLLLLEDDDLLAESLAESLKDNGYLVDVAASVQAAASFMATEEYVLAIVDLGLPDGDGIGVLRSMLRRDWHGRSILITAYPDPTLRAVASMNGFHAVLDKPIRQHELIAALA